MSLVGADQPFGVSRKLSYQMVAEQYTGRVLYVTFRTDADLSRWLPPPLELAEPREAFLKIYELRRRPVTGKPFPPAFCQYNEACITVMAAPPGEVPRHYNLFMWVTHDWALYKARAALGWPKKIANIALTSTYPPEDRKEAGAAGFEVDVDRYGYALIRVRARLDRNTPAAQGRPFNGFYTVRHIPAPVGGGEDIRELLVIEPRDCWFRNAVWGSATVEFGDAPDEELGLLGPVEVTSCVLRDTGWILPAWPARRLMSLVPFATDLGSDKPS